MNKIINAKDFLFRKHAKTYKEYINITCNEMLKLGVLDTPFIDCEPVGKPVYAQVDFGQWVAVCPVCGGGETVMLEEPIFYCFSCANFENHGKPRTVIFPSEKEMKDIEKILLERPVVIKRGAHAIERVLNAEPTIIDKYGVLSRNWTPDQSVKDLRKENKESIKGKVNYGA